MLDITCAYDVCKDAENYIKILFNKYPDRGGGKDMEKFLFRFLYPSVLKKIKEAQNQEEAEKIIIEFLENWYKNNKLVIQLNTDALVKLWETKRKYFFKGLKNLFGKELDWKEVKIYFTTLSKCPYYFKEKWFMVDIRSGLEVQLQLIYHELFHFVFFEYYFDYCQDKLNPKQIDILKEALVVLLNSHYFSGVSSLVENGHTAYKDIMIFLWQEYVKNKENFNFLYLLDKGIEYMQKNKDWR